MSGGTSLISRLVATSIRFPLIVLLLAVALRAAALIYTARHFAMTADTAQLISTKLAWRQRELAFQAALPQLDNLTMIVVDGVTPELADDAGHPHWQFDALDSLPDHEVGGRATNGFYSQLDERRGSGHLEFGHELDAPTRLVALRSGS